MVEQLVADEEAVEFRRSRHAVVRRHDGVAACACPKRCVQHGAVRRRTNDDDGVDPGAYQDLVQLGVEELSALDTTRGSSPRGATSGKIMVPGAVVVE